MDRKSMRQYRFAVHYSYIDCSWVYVLYLASRIRSYIKYNTFNYPRLDMTDCNQPVKMLTFISQIMNKRLEQYTVALSNFLLYFGLWYLTWYQSNNTLWYAGLKFKSPLKASNWEDNSSFAVLIDDWGEEISFKVPLTMKT